MAKRKAVRTMGTKKIMKDKKKQINEAIKSCPYEEKKCLECDIQECPEEGM